MNHKKQSAYSIIGNSLKMMVNSCFFEKKLTFALCKSQALFFAQLRYFATLLPLLPLQPFRGFALFISSIYDHPFSKETKQGMLPRHRLKFSYITEVMARQHSVYNNRKNRYRRPSNQLNNSYR